MKIKRNKFLLLGILVLLFTGCQTETDLSIDIGDNFNIDFLSVNEIGVFGTGHTGMLYHDLTTGKDVPILKNTADKIYMFDTIQGVCYYNNKIYYFDNFENAALYTMDINGTNAKKLLDLRDDAYSQTKTKYQFIYNDNKIVFNLAYTKWHPDSKQNEIYEQLWIYDIETSDLSAITDKVLSKGIDVCTPAAYIDDKIIYYETSLDENFMSMEDFESTYGSNINYPQYKNEHTSRIFYSYDVKTKESQEFLKGKGIEVDSREARHETNLVFREKNEIKQIDVNSKKVETLLKDEHLYGIYTSVDNKVFYTTLDGTKNDIKYYDFITKKSEVSETYEIGKGEGFFPIHETKEYFVGLQNSLNWCYLRKEDFKKGDFSQLKSIGW